MPPSPALALGLFFTQPSSAPAVAFALQRHVQQVRLQFLSSAMNRLFVYATNQRQLDIARTIGLLRQHAHIPTALGFVQATQEQIDLAMITHHPLVTRRSADSTLTLMNLSHGIRHAGLTSRFTGVGRV